MDCPHHSANVCFFRVRAICAYASNTGLPQLERNVAAAPQLDESYDNLKRLVEQVIEQVFKIPELLDYSGVPGREHVRAAEFDPKKYEELLATAVLNKVSGVYCVVCGFILSNRPARVTAQYEDILQQ